MQKDVHPLSQSARSKGAKQRIDQLTGYLAHALVVLAAVSGFLTVGVAVAHGFPPAVLEALVVAARAAAGTLPLAAARLGRPHEPPADERQVSTNHEAEARRAPSTRTHGRDPFRLLRRLRPTCSTNLSRRFLGASQRGEAK